METNRPVASKQPGATYAPPTSAFVGLFSFTGRIGRASFWKVWVTMILGIVVLGMLAAVFIPKIAATFTSPGDASSGGAAGNVAMVVVIAVYATVIWISLATQAKRFHDMDKSAWFVLLNLIPIVGFITFLWQGFAQGTEAPNRFGPRALQVRLSA